MNAANGHLAHGGGVAGIIARAAGPALQEESDRLVRERGPFATGSAVATTAGKLPFKGVIHAVGPRFGEGDEERKLVQALLAAWKCAAERGWATYPTRRSRAASSPCRSTSAPAPTWRRRGRRRCVMSGYACATNRSSMRS